MSEGILAVAPAPGIGSTQSLLLLKMQSDVQCDVMRIEAEDVTHLMLVDRLYVSVEGAQ